MLELWWLPLAIAALGALTRQPEPRPWSWGADLGLAALCGLLLAAACDAWLVPLHLSHFPYTVTDLHEYCGTIEAMRTHGGAGASPQRSQLAGLLAAGLAPSLGILGALRTASLIHLGLTGAGLYLWGRALQGREAGVLAATMAAALSPLVIMGRDLRFYPAMTAVFVLGAATCALALRFRRWPALLLAGTFAGLCFLIDLRGLIWGLSFTALGLIAAAWGPWRTLPLRLLAFASPLPLAWYLGRFAYPAGARSLEWQVDVAKRISEAGLEPGWSLNDLAPSAYIWGRTPVSDIPGTLRNLVEQASRVPAELSSLESHQVRVEAFITPWLNPGLAALALALLATARGPARLPRLLAMATLVPFLASGRSALNLDTLQPHYLALIAPGLALVLGLGLGSLAWLMPGPPKGPTWVRGAAIVGLGLLLVGGVMPSPLSPAASWRMPMRAAYEDFSRMLELAERPASEVTGRGLALDPDLCAAGLRADLAEGHDLSAYDPRGLEAP